MTRRLAVLGDPIDHSLSPRIHSGWIDDYSLNARYEAIRIEDGTFQSGVNELCIKGFTGFNVTLPHKHRALEFSGKSTPRAQAIGAANTLTYLNDESIWLADNTDAPGFMMALNNIIDSAALKTKTIVVLGAGGAARAVVYSLKPYADRLTLLNRTAEKAADLSHELVSGKAASGGLEYLAACIDSETILINTTSAGHNGALLPLPNRVGTLFYDISYGAAADRQLAMATELGWRTADGLSMLVGQAAASFETWFGIAPDIDRAMLRCRNK